MKILTWNCNGAFRKKLHLFVHLDVDIFIIQECEHTLEAQKIYNDWYPNYCWKGKNQNKGIAIFAKSDFILSRLNWQDNGLELFLPVQVNQMQFLVIWTKYANSPTFQYIGQLWKYLQQHQSKLVDVPTILCGDWNSNAKWDVWDRWWNHSDVVNILSELNIRSVYHAVMNEQQGSETQPTFYMQRNLNKPYHIDYLFSSVELFNPKKSKLHIFEPEEWLKYSDHLPILFELQI